ncbi:hypothetical protein BD413DRAFT_612011 [Trametes elegans]|nr:hypothetical protein BD413DRAFT_612011 [Trametes elegans]
MPALVELVIPSGHAYREPPDTHITEHEFAPNDEIYPKLRQLSRVPSGVSGLELGDTSPVIAWALASVKLPEDDLSAKLCRTVQSEATEGEDGEAGARWSSSSARRKTPADWTWYFGRALLEFSTLFGVAPLEDLGVFGDVQCDEALTLSLRPFDEQPLRRI